MRAYAGTFAKTTAASAASQQVTFDFGGETPNVVLFFSSGPNALDTWTAGIKNALGFAADDAGTIKNRGLAWGSDDNVATSQISKSFSNTKCITLQVGGATPTATANILAQGELTSFIADGFNLSWTKNDANATRIGFLALKVPSVAIRNFNTPSSPGSGSITGLSFAPELLFSLNGSTAGYTTTAPGANEFIGFGWAAKGSGHQATQWNGLDNQATMAVSTYHRSDVFNARHPSTTTPGTSPTNTLAVSAWNSDGITYNAAATTESRPIEVLLIGGVEAIAEKFAKSTAAAPVVQSRSGYGFVPKAAIVLSPSENEAVGSTAHIRESFGVMDGTREVSSSYYDTSGLADSNANARMTEDKVTGTITGDADAFASTADGALDADGISLTWATNSANAFDVYVLVMGDPAPTAVPVSDSGTVSATESLGISATLPVSDTDTVSGTEALAAAVTRSISDTGTVSVTESISAAATLPVADSGTVSATESVSVQAGTVAAVSDDGAFSATEALSAAAALSVSDAGTVSATESTSASSTLPVSDSDTIGATEALAASSTLSVSDADTLSATEAVDVASANAAEASDSGPVSATESLAIVTTLAVSDADTVSVTDSLARAVFVSVTDTDTVSITDAVAIITGKFLALADTDTISAPEGRSIAAVMILGDEGIVGAIELLAGDFAPPAAPVPIVTPGRGGGVTMAVALWRATIDNVLIEDLSTHGVEGNVSMNLDRAIKLAASFTIPDPDRVTPYVDYLAPFLTLEFDDGSPTISRQLGLFGVRVPPAMRGPDAGIATFAGEDLTTNLANSAYAAPDEVPSGTLFRAELVQTIEEAGITRYSIPNTTRTTGYHRTYPPGTTRMEKVTRLTERMRMYQPYMDLEGRIATQNTFSKRVTEPYVTIGDGDLLEEIQVQPSDLQIANVVIVVRDNANEAPLSGVARDDDPSSPTSTVSIGREIVRVVRVQELEDQADADGQAARYLEEGRSYYRTARLVTLPNARFGFHQVLDLALTGHWAALNGRWMVRAWDVGFSPESVALVQTVNQLTSALGEEAA